MLPAAKEHLQAAQDRDKRRHSGRTHDSSGVPWQRHPYREGDFVYLRRPPRNTRRRTRRRQFCGCTGSPVQVGWSSGAPMGSSASQSTHGTLHLARFPGWSLSRSICSSAGAAAPKRGEEGSGAHRGDMQGSWGVLRTGGHPLSPVAAGGVGGNGHQESGRFAGAMGSSWRSSGDLGVCPGQTQR